MKRVARNNDGPDERGIVTVILAAAIAMLMAATALSVDVGRVVVRNRSLQSVADAVALDAVSVLNGSPASSISGAVHQEAVASAGRNGFVPASAGGPAGSNLVVTLGVWDPVQRTFTPVSDSDPTTVPDAVRVQPGADVGYVLSIGKKTLNRTATASTVPLAGFSIGSWLASFDSTQVTVLNGLLSTLGTTADLTAVGYQGLATSSLRLSDLLAADSGFGTVSNLLSASFPPKTLLSDTATALGDEASSLLAQGDAADAAPLQAAQGTLNSLVPGVTATAGVQLCKLISVGASCTPSDQPAASAAVNVLSLVVGIAEVANASSGFSVNLGVGYPVKIGASLIHPAVVVPPSPPGTKADTDQVDTSLGIDLGLGNTLKVTSTGATGHATLNTVGCTSSPRQTAYGVTTDAASLTAVVTTALASYNSTDGVTGASGSLQFPAPWSPADGQSVSTRSPSVSFSFSALPPNLVATVNTVLNALDPQIPDILTALGVAMAGATVTSWPTECKAPVLVQ